MLKTPRASGKRFLGGIGKSFVIGSPLRSASYYQEHKPSFALRASAGNFQRS
ncbi:hypothetical protein VDG1235_591 [Verrucomicrobiia bacterium DG1235]|nr:hypothetical protein VDG1235_591 [Verrucomicrobiae bacterium DG1235]